VWFKPLKNVVIRSKFNIVLTGFLLFAIQLVAGNNIQFIENKGQWPSSVLFKAQLQGQNIYFEKDRMLFQVYDLVDVHDHGNHNHSHQPVIKGHVYEVKLLQAKSIDSIQKKTASNFNLNYFKGNNSNAWQSGVKSYSSFTLCGIYDGIDLKLYQQNQLLKYDFIVHPGADPAQIKMQYSGANKVKIKSGQVEIKTSVGQIYEGVPLVFQMQNQNRNFISAKYKLKKNILSFDITQSYNKTQKLIIDPTLIFSSYSGSSANNFGFTATYDEEGFLYAGSCVFDLGYPTTFGAFQTNFGGGVVDIAISKYDTSGTNLIYSTYIGGTFGELPHSMIVDYNNNLVILGSTSSANYPISNNAYDPTFNGGNWSAINSGSYYAQNTNNINGAGTDIIISKLNNEGILVASTFLGGTNNDGISNSDDLVLNYADDFRGSINITDNNEILIGTSTLSSNIPVTNNALQSNLGGRQDGYIAKLSPNLDSLMYASFIGGSQDDAIYSVMYRDSFLLFGGSALSQDINVIDRNFPDSITFSTNYASGIAGLIDIKNYDSSNVFRFGSAQSTDQIYFVDFDSDNAFYIMGQTESNDENFFIQNVGYSVSNSGQFITKLNPNLDSIEWSTLWGNGQNNPNISPAAFMVDFCNRIYVSGWGTNWMAMSNDHPRGTTVDMDITNDAFQTTTDGGDFYLMVLSQDADSLLYATYIGGNLSQEHVDGGTSRFDKRGIIYQSVCAGCQGNSDFPIEPNNAHSSNNGSFSCNNAVFKLSFDQELLVADFQIETANCPGKAFSFTNTSTFLDSAEVLWNFGDGSTSDALNPNHLYHQEGEYEVSLRVSNPNICNAVDIITKTIKFDTTSTIFLDSIITCGQNITIGPSNPDVNATYNWLPSLGLDKTNVANPQANTDEPITYTIYKFDGLCRDTLYQFVQLDTVQTLSPRALKTATDCNNYSVDLIANSNKQNNVSYYWTIQQDTVIGQNINYNFNKSGSYKVNLFANYNNICSILDSTALEVHLIADSSYRLDSVITCLDALQIGINPYNFEMEYFWNDPTHLDSSNISNPITSLPDSFDYRLIAKLDECADTFYQFIDISGLNENIMIISSADTINQFETVDISINTINNFKDSIVWNAYDNTPAAPANQIGYTSNSLIQTTTFTATAILKTDTNCRKELSKTVYIRPYRCQEDSIFIPNAFTPNNDNENDVVNISYPDFEIYHFKIYDRYGNLVYHANDENPHHTNPWDGTFNGVKLESGVYVYYLEGKCTELISKQGNITLIR